MKIHTNKNIENTTLKDLSKEELIKLVEQNYTTIEALQEEAEQRSQLSKVNQKWSFFVQHSPFAYLELDLEGKILQWNIKAEKIFGFSEEEAIGKPVYELVCSVSDTSKLKNSLKDDRSMSFASHIYVKNITKDGDQVICNWYFTLIYGETKEDDKWICVVQDNTQRLEAEFALRESEEKFRNIIHHSLDGVTFTNEEGIVVEWNQGLREITEVRGNDAIGKYIWDVHYDLLPPEKKTSEEYERLKVRRQIGLKNGFYKKNEALSNDEIVTPSGTRKTISTVIFLVETAKGHIHCSITRDITAAKKSEKDLKIKNDKLEEINREKDSIMDIVAHDLKAPLNKVRGLTQLIEMDGELNENQKEYVKLIKKEIQLGSSLIRDLLDLSAFEHKKWKPNISKVNVNDLIEEFTNSYQNSITKKNISVEVLAQHDSIECFSDKDSIMRIFDNLFSNALKFSPIDTVITVKIVKIENTVTLSVKDQGPGLSVEDQAKMFKKFQQLSAQPTGGESSTGLGLSIIKMLINRLGGTIEVKSKLNKGSEFIVTFPCMFTDKPSFESNVVMH